MSEAISPALRLYRAAESGDVVGIASALDDGADRDSKVVEAAFMMSAFSGKANACRALFDALDDAARRNIALGAVNMAAVSEAAVEMTRLMEDLYGDAHDLWSEIVDLARGSIHPRCVNPGSRAAILYLAATCKEHRPDRAEAVDAKIAEFEAWLDGGSP